MRVSGYKLMWVLVLFDLPVNTKKSRHDYAVFRKRLKGDGFQMLQFSVYGRACASQENATVHIRRIRSYLPPEGQVRILLLTDRQYGRQEIFTGKRRAKSEKAPDQLEFF